MRRVGVAMVMTGLVLAGCGDGPSASACPAQAVEYRSYIGENDNPAPAGLPRQAEAWDAAYAELGRLGRPANGEECSDRLPDVKRAVQGIEDLGYGLQEYDPSARSDEPRAVRAYIADQGLDDPDGEKNADRVDRLAPAARQALAPAFSSADGLDPADGDAVEKALADVADLATTDPDVKAWLAALEQLDVGEYDEP